MTQTICNERHKSMNTSATGWKIVDGKKIYSTFRDHQLVHGSGFEGYKLFHSDHHKAGQKRKPPNSDDIDPSNKENISSSGTTSYKKIHNASKKQRI